MKAKPKFDKDKAKTFLLQHVEKIIFGVMVLVAVMLCWSAFGLTPYKGTPDDLKKKANDVSQRLQTSTPPEPLTDLPPKRDLNRMLRNALADVNPGLFPMSEISRPYADRKVRRQQPKLLAVVDLKPTSGFGAIATSPNGGKFAARRGGMDMMQDGGMPGGFQAPEMQGAMQGMMPDDQQGMMSGAMPGGAMPGMGAGGMADGMGMQGRGRGKKPAKAKKPAEKPKVKAAPEPVKYALEVPGGAKLEGKYWVSLVGLIPAWDQDAEFQKVFRDAIKTSPADMPQYVTCEVERAEIVSPGEVGEYQALDMDQAFEYMGKWAAEYPEVVDEKYLTPSYDVSEPLPPLVLANHDPNAVRHPKIPLKDEAAADAKKAAEEEEGEDESDKKKPRRSSRMRGRAGSGAPGMMSGGMPGMMSGGMPGMMPGQMPGMNPMAGMPGMGQAAREKIEFKLFRFFDFDVTPGKTYKYRVRLVLANPNYKVAKRYLADPQLAEDEVLYTDWSEPSPDVFVPLGSELLAGEINPKEPNAKVMVRQFDKDTAITAVHIFDLARGATANENAVKVPTPAKSGMPDATTEEEIDFNTNATVVDLTGGEKLAMGPKGKMPGRVLVMRSDGELALLSEFADAAKFEVESDRLKEAKEKAEKKPNAGMMPEATADPAGGGFGNFFQDQEPAKKKPRR